ncbi:hypothetical protein BGZ60DRAFT_409544 [Tricladium varicosporioides]|nr:hypothetical protein BGZ60DRAFT_409544 [Hymenoscyphus varicosporioides]
MAANANADTGQQSVLIVGGCGFVGSHIVRSFVAQSTFASIAVLSRAAADVTNIKNHIKGATYYTGDLTNHTEISQLVDNIRPTVIIHAASPSPITGTPKEYERVTLHGTENLLKVAKASEYVRVFIYTSSSTLAKGAEHLDLAEDYPLADTDPTAPAYAKFKALADIMVLKANHPLPITSGDVKTTWQGYLLTGSLRFPIVYGTHDLVTIPGCLNALRQGQTNMQIGDGKNLWAFCSTENCADSHVLLSKTLLSGASNADAKVDGEAFNINDGEPQLFWDFARAVWKFAGHSPHKPEKIIIIPSWLALGLASFLEFVFWVFTLGSKRPQTLGKQQVEYACFTHTYSIEKAKTRLGFQPRQDFEGGLRDAVAWSLEHGGWAEKLKKLKISTA